MKVFNAFDGATKDPIINANKDGTFYGSDRAVDGLIVESDGIGKVVLGGESAAIVGALMVVLTEEV